MSWDMRKMRNVKLEAVEVNVIDVLSKSAQFKFSIVICIRSGLIQQQQAAHFFNLNH